MNHKADKFAEKTIQQLNFYGEQYCNKGKMEEALDFFRTSAKLQFCYNQWYCDDYIEKQLKKIALKINIHFTHEKDEKTVLFYDGFGHDIRGLAYIYLESLCKSDYDIIYITCQDNCQNQPNIMRLLKDERHKVYHISNIGKIEKIEKIIEIFKQEKFSIAFFYTTPWDVSAVVAFNELAGKCIRYQINLTDHAFWLGKNTFDYCLEFRPYGAAVSKTYRKINPSQLIYMPYYPVIQNNATFKGFPFSTQGKKIVFSGGSLTKTIDEKKTYYRLVENVIEKHKDVIFLYAGDGPKREMLHLISKYPHRVYLIQERDDLLQILKRARIYLNTFPISGGLMLQYAAMADCVPVTLRREWDEDACGILKNEEALKEIFTEYQQACKEIDRLLDDDKYWMDKRRVLKGQVITEQQFHNRLSDILKNPIQNIMRDTLKVDTRQFLQTYKENITLEDVAIWTFDRECNINIMCKKFPHIAIIRLYYKLLHMRK